MRTLSFFLLELVALLFAMARENFRRGCFAGIGGTKCPALLTHGAQKTRSAGVARLQRRDRIFRRVVSVQRARRVDEVNDDSESNGRERNRRRRRR